MLTRFHKILIGLLALQLVLAAVILLRGEGPAIVKDAPLLAGFDAEKVTRVRVFADGSDQPAVELVKKGAAWVVASHFDYPADPVKVKNALSPLAKVAAGEPIATSATRHKQLRVADKDFDRKLVIDAGGTETTIYTGGPAGARRTAVRLGDDKVYAASGVSLFGSEPSAFVSTKYVEVPAPEVARLVVQRGEHAIELERVAAPAAAPAGAGSGSGSAAAPPAETWKLSIDGAPVTLAAGESLDTEAIDRLVGEAAAIDLRAPGDPKRDASKPTATITIQRKGAAQPIVLDAILEAAPPPAAGASGPAPIAGESYWIHQRGLDRAIVADKSELAELVQADRDKLVKKPPPPAPPAGAGSAANPPGPITAPGAPIAPLPGR